MHILFLMVYCVIWDIHVHCGIYENCLFIISSGLAWCHHAPDLYMASNGHKRMSDDDDDDDDDNDNDDHHHHSEIVMMTNDDHDNNNHD